MLQVPRAASAAVSMDRAMVSANIWMVWSVRDWLLLSVKLMLGLYRRWQ
jgi:hypothetical protein